ncbi:MAG: HAD family hydrolase [Erysipelotrichaceae bacterium]|nr:HAD family hydrolase [Erysipelotrichaceae bacterium]
MKEYENYIFDLYGTLVDIHTDETKLLFWKKISDVFRRYGADYAPRELRDLYFGEVDALSEKKKNEGRFIEIDLYDVFLKLYERKGIDADEKTIRETAALFRTCSTSHLRLYAGAKELLKMLKEKGKRVYLLSNAQELFTMKELEELGILADFDDIFISSAYGYRKPDPGFFEALIEKHGLNVNKSLMIGNDPDSDIKGADSVSMDSYYIRSALSPKEGSDVTATYRQDHMDLSILKRMILNSMEES